MNVPCKEVWDTFQRFIGQVILFPSTNSWWALVGVVIVDTIGAALQLRVLWKCVVSDRRRTETSCVFVVLGVHRSLGLLSLVALLSSGLSSTYMPNRWWPPNSDGLPPHSEGLQRSSDGLQPGSNGPPT